MNADSDTNGRLLMAPTRLPVLTSSRGAGPLLRSLRSAPFRLFEIGIGLWLATAAHAATINVTTTTDSVSNDGLCSLREAILSANSDTAVGGCVSGSGTDQIMLGSVKTYHLTIAGTDEDAASTGDLDITHDLSIEGHGSTVDAGGIDRAFQILAGATVGIADLIVQNGNVQNPFPPEDGGGVLNQGTLTLNNVILTHNSADFGGGIANEGGATLVDVTISSNAANVDGGGITNGFFSSSANLTLTKVTLANNSVGPDADGGGMRNDGTAALTNTTITGGGAGGGIVNFGTVTLTNCTVVGNSASGGNGGIRSTNSVTLENTILANNSPQNCTSNGSFVSLGHNLDSGMTCGFNMAGDLSNTDPRLAPLGNNGGPTQTLALCGGVGTPDPACTGFSPAIDAGGASGCPASDQRGMPRPIDGDRNGTATCDIGAYEFQPPPPTSTPVSTHTATNTATPTRTPSTRPTVTNTPFPNTPTGTATATNTATPTRTPSTKPTGTNSPFPNTPTGTATATNDPSPTRTQTNSPTQTAMPDPTVVSRCTGDCESVRSVSFTDLGRCFLMFNGSLPPTNCPRCNPDGGIVSFEELGFAFLNWRDGGCR